MLCTYACTMLYMHVCIRMHIDVQCMYLCECKYVFVYTYMCENVYVWRVCMWICLHGACMHTPFGGMYACMSVGSFYPFEWIKKINLNVYYWPMYSKMYDSSGITFCTRVYHYSNTTLSLIDIDIKIHENDFLENQIWTILGSNFENTYKTFPHQLLRKLYLISNNMTLKSKMGGRDPF